MTRASQLQFSASKRFIDPASLGEMVYGFLKLGRIEKSAHGGEDLFVAGTAVFVEQVKNLPISTGDAMGSLSLIDLFS